MSERTEVKMMASTATLLFFVVPGLKAVTGMQEDTQS